MQLLESIELFSGCLLKIKDASDHPDVLIFIIVYFKDGVKAFCFTERVLLDLSRREGFEFWRSIICFLNFGFLVLIGQKNCILQLEITIFMVLKIRTPILSLQPPNSSPKIRCQKSGRLYIK